MFKTITLRRIKVLIGRKSKNASITNLARAEFATKKNQVIGVFRCGVCARLLALLQTLTKGQTLNSSQAILVEYFVFPLSMWESRFSGLSKVAKSRLKFKSMI